MHSPAFLAVALSLSTTCLSAYAGKVLGPVAHLHIVNDEISPDGFTRAAVLADGQFPGPLITAYKGDRFLINVTDNLQNHTMLKSTSIEFHGFTMKGANWESGPAFTNQCPISTGHSYLYDFQSPDLAGTFWYHSHLMVQICDGLRGPLVIKDPEDPHLSLYDVDDENTVITLADWYHTAANLVQGVARSDAVVVNGLGRFPNGTNSPLSVIEVQQGKRYRLRVVSISCDSSFIYSIDKHVLTIIEADATNIVPLEVVSVQIFAGQRYSHILDANQPIGNYWIRAQSSTSQLANFNNSAILRYVGAPNEEPTTPPVPSQNPLFEQDLRPLDAKPAVGGPSLGDVDVAINLDLGFDTSAGKFTVNGVPFVQPTIPVLLQVLSGVRNVSELMPTGSFITLPRNKTIEVSIPIPNGTVATTGPHAINLHGHKLQVIRSAGTDTLNFDNPIRRDVIASGNRPGLDNITFRFETNNPGPWLLQCHIFVHYVGGFGILFAEDLQDAAIANPVPTEWTQLCPIFESLDPEDQ